MGTSLTDNEIAFLRAAQELVACQEEVCALLARANGFPVSDLHRARWTHRLTEDGPIAGTDWNYYFHGMECDFANRKDGLYVRVDFGPGGRIDTFSGYGVLQFVMSSGARLPEFASLRTFLAAKPPPFDHASGSFDRARALEDRLEDLGLFEECDPELAALVERCTEKLPDGTRSVRLPDTMDEFMKMGAMCCSRRLVISASGRALIGASRSPGAQPPRLTPSNPPE